MLKLRTKRRSLNKIEEKETVSSKRKKTKSESENEFDDDEEEEDFDSPMDNTDEDSDYNPTKEKEKSSSSEDENTHIETESKFFKTNSLGIRKKPPWYKSISSPGTSFKSPAPKQGNLLDSDSSSDEFERVPDSLDDLGGFERLNKEVKKEDSEGEMESESKVTEYFDFSQIIQSQEVLKAAAIKKEKDGVAPNKRVKQRSAGNKKIRNADNKLDVMELLALGEGAKIGGKKKDDESDDTDEGDDQYCGTEGEKVDSKPKAVEVTIAFPSLSQHKKKDKKASDVEAALKRRFNLVKKENQVFAHKVHLLCWIAHGNHLNSVLNCEDLMGVALSIIPSNYCYPPKRCDLTYLENFVKWFREKIKIDPVLGKDVMRPQGIVTSQRLQEQFNKHMANSRLDQVLLFIATLRALGLLVRLIINLRPVPLKPPVKELFTFKSSQESGSSKSDKSKKVVDVKKEVGEGNGKGETRNKITKSDADKDGETSGKNIKKEFKEETNKGKTSVKEMTKSDTNKDGEKRIKKVEKEVEDEANEEGDTGIKEMTKSGKNGESSVKKTTTKKNSKNTESKENEESSSPEVIKRSSKRNLKNVDEGKKEEKSNSEVGNKRTSKRNVNKGDEGKGRGGVNVDNEEYCSKDEEEKGKSRSKAMSKSKAVEDESTNVEENVTRSSRRVSNVMDKTDDNNDENDTRTSTRSSRSNSKVAALPKSNKVPDKVNVDEKKGRTRSVSSLKKNDDKTDENKKVERGSRSRSMSSKIAKEDVKSKDGRSSTDKSGSTSKYFESDKETLMNGVNGYEDGEERVGRGKRQKKNLVENLKEVESSEDEEEEKNKKKSTKGKSSVSKKSEKKSTKIKTESDEEFELESSYFKSKNKIDRRVLSSDDDAKSEANKKNKKKNQTDEWAEVFLEAEEKWICVDLTKGMIHCVQQLYSSATQPVTHVLGWENNKAIKDLTRRYVPHFMTVTRKQRVEDEWWARALRPFAPPRNARNREEDEDLDKQMEDQPLPTSISEYKNHPLYALQRHLLKFQAIYPPDAPTLGFIRNEPVYSRTCVAELHCRESWIKFAKVVRPGEEPYKMVKARPKFDKMTGEFRSDLPLPLFGPWQVDDYVPPPAKDGKVPRNEYGNVELFQPSMLPAGTVHLKLPGLNRVAKKLQIDCAAAVVGWDFHGGSSHVVIDGYVVCEEFEETLVEAWHQEQQEAEKRAREKMEQKVYGNWKRLIKGLLIREKLKLKYGFEIEDEVVAGSSGKGQKPKKGECSKKGTKK